MNSFSVVQCQLHWCISTFLVPLSIEVCLSFCSFCPCPIACILWSRISTGFPTCKLKIHQATFLSLSCSATQYRHAAVASYHLHVRAGCGRKKKCYTMAMSLTKNFFFADPGKVDATHLTPASSGFCFLVCCSPPPTSTFRFTCAHTFESLQSWMYIPVCVCWKILFWHHHSLLNHFKERWWRCHTLNLITHLLKSRHTNLYSWC